MSSSIDKNCTFLVATDRSSSLTQEDICKDIESGEIPLKIRGLKNAVLALMGGESMPRILMTVIRFCINCDDKQVKKLLMLYWEITPKYAPDGKLQPEMILVCNALRNDLMSPNEFIRGCMLRFLCKMKELEILEPLIPSVKAALEHRHSYVRRNGALAIYHIYKTFGEQLLPDGAELMDKFIADEVDTSARRNAFLMLFNEAEGIAIDFLAERIDDIGSYGDSFALLVLELSRKTCRRDPAQKSRFVRCLFQLLQSTSQAVQYEAAWTLVSLSTAPTAVRACAQTYANLLNQSNDNNVKLIILDRLFELKAHHSKVVREMLMDILRVLGSPNMDISRKVLQLTVEMVGPRNIEEVMQVLKREVVRAQEMEQALGEEYKTILIQTIHKCASRYAEVADSVVLVLLDFLGGSSGYEVLQCVKGVLEQYPDFRAVIVRKIVDNLEDITLPEAYRIAVWILGEYGHVEDPNDGQTMLLAAFERMSGMLGESPFELKSDKKGAEESKVETVTTTKNVVLQDGTYASVTSTEQVGGPENDAEAPVSMLRRLVCEGDILLGTVCVATMTKLSLKAASTASADAMYSTKSQTLLAAAGIGRLAETKRGLRVGVYSDCLDRLSQCCRVLLVPEVKSKMGDTYTLACRAAYSDLVEGQIRSKAKASAVAKVLSNPDDLIQFRQLRSQAVQGGIEIDLMDADDIGRATGASDGAVDTSKLQHVYQLTGFSDPVYAEATVMVHDYDIVMDMLIINRTPNTLTNLTVELGTVGDLKLVERPQSYTVGPMDERRIKANIKVSSTETGNIFGTIVFENSSNAQKTIVNLSDIQLNIMDYIRPAECKSEDFRSMWAEFEWENKVAINTNLTDLKGFLDHISTHANMRCLDDTTGDYGNSNFLAANLYARSVFGEDALVNLSIERKEEPEPKLSGYIRIRSKTQGIALSLGDRITSVQRVSGDAREQ